MRVYNGYSGSGIFAQVAIKRGHKAVTCDANPLFKPNRLKDALEEDPEEIANNFDLVQLSPMCTSFSLASGGTHWMEDKRPKTVSAVIGRAHLRHCIKILEACDRKGIPCFIENPVGRATWFMPPAYKKIITYCQYGDDSRKPTHIWTNSLGWKPRPICQNGDKCHEASPRGTNNTGTQSKKDNYERSILPEALCEEIIKAVEKNNKIFIQNKLVI